MGIRQAEGREKGVGRRRGGADKQIDRQTVAAAGAAVADAANDALALPFGVAFLCVVGSLCN